MDPEDLEAMGLDEEEVEGTLGGFNPEYDDEPDECDADFDFEDDEDE